MNVTRRSQGRRAQNPAYSLRSQPIWVPTGDPDPPRQLLASARSERWFVQRPCIPSRFPPGTVSASPASCVATQEAQDGRKGERPQGAHSQKACGRRDLRGNRERTAYASGPRRYSAVNIGIVRTPRGTRSRQMPAPVAGQISSAAKPTPFGWAKQAPCSQCRSSSWRQKK